MREKWYKYKDKCPGCGTEFLRKDGHAYLACAICGFIVSAPSYRESSKESHFLRHSVDGVMKEITIAHYCEMQRMVVQEVKRLPALA